MNLTPTRNIVKEAQVETRAFLNHQSIGNTATYELFRRAFVLRDEEAWTGLYFLYRSFLRKNIQSTWQVAYDQGQVTHFLSEEDLDEILNIVYAKFARNITPEKFATFVGVGALINYLKLCMHSVMVDTYRASKRQWRDISLDLLLTQEEDEEVHFPDELITDPLATFDPDQDLLAALIAVAKTQQEKGIIYRLLEGLSPRELVETYPTLFPTAHVVYNAQHNYRDRGARDHRVAELLRDAS